MQRKRNDSGQALFEFLVFIPLFLILIAMMLVVGNGINNSINQQKLARGYFYYLTQNSPYIPFRPDAEGLVATSSGEVTRISMDYVGYRASSDGDESFSTCLKFPTFLGQANPQDECREPDITDNKAQYLRVFTAYGVCSAHIFFNPNFQTTFHRLDAATNGVCAWE